MSERLKNTFTKAMRLDTSIVIRTTRLMYFSGKIGEKHSYETLMEMVNVAHRYQQHQNCQCVAFESALSTRFMKNTVFSLKQHSYGKRIYNLTLRTSELYVLGNTGRELNTQAERIMLDSFTGR